MSGHRAAIAKSAVVMVVGRQPLPGTGGPQGLCYRLLEALCHLAEPRKWELYCISLAGPRCYRVAKPEDLEQFTAQVVSGTWEARLRDRAYRAECGRVPRLRDAMHVLRRARDIYRQVRLKPLLQRLLSSHRRVLFHAHVATCAYSIARALDTADARRWRLVITEHSKGGALREYEELIGSAAIRDRNYASLAYQTKVAVSSAHRMIFPSQGARELWEDHNQALTPLIAAKTAIIYNGVPEPVVAAVLPVVGELRLFGIAEHVPEKGLDRVMRGMAELKLLWPNRPIRLRIAGALTRLTPELTEARRHLGLEKEVQFLGMVPHRTVLKELAAAQMLVGSPRVAVFDLAVLEGMAMGKPIITCRLPGTVEALGNQYPFFAGDEFELARKIALCDTDRRLTAQTGSANRRRYEQLFTSDAMALRHRELYAELLDAPP